MIVALIFYCCQFDHFNEVTEFSTCVKNSKKIQKFQILVFQKMEVLLKKGTQHFFGLEICKMKVTRLSGALVLVFLSCVRRSVRQHESKSGKTSVLGHFYLRKVAFPPLPTRPQLVAVYPALFFIDQASALINLTNSCTSVSL